MVTWADECMMNGTVDEMGAYDVLQVGIGNVRTARTDRLDAVAMLRKQ